jgi:hypothetical protein
VSAGRPFKIERRTGAVRPGPAAALLKSIAHERLAMAAIHPQRSIQKFLFKTGSSFARPLTPKPPGALVIF